MLKREEPAPEKITFQPPAPAPAPPRRRRRGGPAIKPGFLDPTGKWQKKEFYIDPAIRKDYETTMKNFTMRMYETGKEADKQEKEAMFGPEDTSDERTKHRRKLADHAIAGYNQVRNEVASEKHREKTMTPEDRRERARRRAKYAAIVKQKAAASEAQRAKDEREQKFWAKEKVKEAKGMMGVRAPVDVGPTRDAFEYEAEPDAVEVWFPLPRWAGPKDVDVRLDLKWFSVGLKGEAPYLECDLWGAIKPAECFWHVEETKDRRDVCLHLEKASPGDFWSDYFRPLSKSCEWRRDPAAPDPDDLPKPQWTEEEEAFHRRFSPDYNPYNERPEDNVYKASLEDVLADVMQPRTTKVGAS